MVATLIAKFEERQRRIIQSLFILLIAMLMLYGYFLVSSVFDALQRKDFEKRSAAAETSVSSVETAYMRAAAEIEEQSAANLGLVGAPEPRFLSRTTPSDGLTLNR